MRLDNCVVCYNEKGHNPKTVWQRCKRKGREYERMKGSKKEIVAGLRSGRAYGVEGKRAEVEQGKRSRRREENMAGPMIRGLEELQVRTRSAEQRKKDLPSKPKVLMVVSLIGLKQVKAHQE